MLGEEEEDTVEKAVEGLADRIIAEDEERRAQDLVRSHLEMFRRNTCKLKAQSPCLIFT